MNSVLWFTETLIRFPRCSLFHSNSKLLFSEFHGLRQNFSCCHVKLHCSHQHFDHVFTETFLFTCESLYSQQHWNHLVKWISQFPIKFINCVVYFTCRKLINKLIVGFVWTGRARGETRRDAQRSFWVQITTSTAFSSVGQTLIDVFWRIEFSFISAMFMYFGSLRLRI